jgi:hypothetical protein
VSDGELMLIGGALLAGGMLAAVLAGRTAWGAS